jgi:hypothetical protein
MSISERSALASSWLEGGGPSSSQHAMQQQVEELRQDSDSDASSNSSDMDEAPPDLLETWVIMECKLPHLVIQLNWTLFCFQAPEIFEAMPAAACYVAVAARSAFSCYN